MTRAKEETSKKTATYDGVCVSDTEGYDRALDIAVARRTRYETEEGELITVHELNIGGQVFTVRSFFGLDERRTPADIVRRMIDAGENTNDGCAEIQTSAHAPDYWSDTGKCDSEIDQRTPLFLPAVRADRRTDRADRKTQSGLRQRRKRLLLHLGRYTVGSENGRFQNRVRQRHQHSEI